MSPDFIFEKHFLICPEQLTVNSVTSLVKKRLVQLVTINIHSYPFLFILQKYFHTL